MTTGHVDTQGIEGVVTDLLYQVVADRMLQFRIQEELYGIGR